MKDEIEEICELWEAIIYDRTHSNYMFYYLTKQATRQSVHMLITLVLALILLGHLIL